MGGGRTSGVLRERCGGSTGFVGDSRGVLIALCLLALAFTFVPSSVTRPILTAPTSSAISKTCSNNPCSVPMWILRKSEIVRKSGSLPAANTLNGMSSCNRFWIRRELNTPVQYPYTNNFVIRHGSYGGGPHFSSPYTA